MDKKILKSLIFVLLYFIFFNTNVKAGTLYNDGNKDTKETSTFFGGTIQRKDVESIEFKNTKEVPSGVIGSWDASVEKDGSIMTWYTDTNNNGLYEVYIGNDGILELPIDSNRLFKNFINVKTLNISNVRTSKVTDMRGMFYGMKSLTSLDVSHFDTSNVTYMGSMFYGMKSLASLNVSHFDTSNVTDMGHMFYGMESLTSLDVSNFDTSKVTNMVGMFSGNDKLKNVLIKNSNIVGNDNFAGSISNKTLVLSPNIDSLKIKGIKDKDNNAKTGRVISGDKIGDNTILIFADSNEDGKVNSADLLKVKLHILNKKELIGFEFKSSDVDFNDNVNANDLLILRNHLIGTKKLFN